MSYNPFTDGESRSAALWNSMHQAHRNNAILSGCELSTGTGDREVEVASGEASIGGGVIGINAQSVTIPASDTTLRIDLVTLDDAGSANVTSGDPAPEPESGEDERPIAPDVPSGEVLAGIVLVRADSAEVLSGDILGEYRTVIETLPASLIEDGSGSGLDADTLRGDYPLPNSSLSNSSITIDTGNQLSGGGSVGLGGSRTLSVDDGEGSGLDADTLRGETDVDLQERALAYDMIGV